MSKDGIFLIHDDGRLVEMQPEDYASEEVLQLLLAEYPNIMAGGQINSAVPRRWLLIGREIGVPATEGGGDQWSLDHLFVDQDAIPTIVEVKRSSDTRIRREVVGQMLDYAANGVRYWPLEQLRSRFEHTAQAREREPELMLAEFLGEDADVDAFWQQIEANLRGGRVRMLFIADRIPPELQRIVEFLNEQMSPAEVLAVEVQQYRGEGVRTLVPRLMGATATAQRSKGVRDRRPFDELLDMAPAEVRELDALLGQWAADNGFVASHSARGRQIRGHDGKTLLQLYVEDGSLEFDFTPLTAAGLTTEVEEIGRRLDELAQRQLTRKYPYVPARPLIDEWLRVVKDVLTPYVEARQRAQTQG